MLGPRIPPTANEAGCKDVVRAMSKLVTRIIVKQVDAPLRDRGIGKLSYLSGAGE